jgi:type II secretory pathway component PulF
LALRREGVRAFSIRRHSQKLRTSANRKRARIAFLRGYAALAAAGMQNEEIITFLRHTVAGQTGPTLAILRRALSGIRRSTRSGASIVEAMSREVNLFTTVDCAVVQSAIEAGKLPSTLDVYSDRLEEDLDFDSSLVSALIQPAITLVGAAIIFPLVAASLTPTLDTLYTTFNIAAPPSFAQLKFVGWLASGPWLWSGYALAAAAGVIAWRSGFLTPLLRRAPLVGNLLAARAAEIAARTLAQAYAAGKSPAAACQYAASAVEDPRIAGGFTAAADALVRGRASNLAEALDQQRGIFDPLFVQYIKMGRDARVPEMAEHAARASRRTVRELIDRIPPTVNTATVLLAGLLVAAMAAYVYAAVSHAVGHVLSGGK